MDSFYIVTNKDKDPEFQTTRFVKEYLEKRGKKCTIRENSAEGGGSYKYTDASVIPEDVDCVLVLGGDGTLLQASRDLTERDLPLLGINMGKLGYLAEVDRRGIEPALERLLAGDYQLVSRMMIYGEVYHQGKKVMEDLALNDIVIGRYGRLRIIDFKIYVNGGFHRLQLVGGRPHRLAGSLSASHDSRSASYAKHPQYYSSGRRGDHSGNASGSQQKRRRRGSDL